MVKKVLCLGLLILLVACTNVFAGGSGNCIETARVKSEHLGVGAVAFEYNLVTERINDLYDGLVDADNIKVEDLSQVYGKITWGRTTDKILWLPATDYNLYFKAGACNYDVKFKDDGVSVKAELESGVYTGVGANALFPLKEVNELCSINWGGDIQLNCFFNGADDVTRNGETVNSDGYFYGIDGQIATYVTCNYDIPEIKTELIPYLGVYYSWIVVGTLAELDYTVANTEYDESIGGAFDVLSFGMLLGLDMNITDYLTLNVEGRFIGETALTTGATFKF